MLALLLFIAFGLLFGYFATLNTDLVSVHFGNLTLEPLPLYILVLISFGMGVLLASVFYAIKYLGNRFALGKKASEVTRVEKEMAELTKQIHKLELENTNLKARTGESSDEDENSL